MAEIFVFPTDRRIGEVRRFVSIYEGKRRKSLLRGQGFWKDEVAKLRASLQALGASAECVELNVFLFQRAASIERSARKGKKLSSADRSAS